MHDITHITKIGYETRSFQSNQSKISKLNFFSRIHKHFNNKF